MVVSHHQSILGNLKVLLVEDEEKVREYIAKSLRYIVSEVQEASNGKEALKILDTFSPDIIITDLEMPVMNGVEFIKTLRKRDKNVCIAVLTAHSTNEYLINLVDMHIEQFIIKPINFDKMLVVLEKCQKVIINKVEQNLYSFLDYTYDFNQKILKYKDTIITLTKKEILFLELLFVHSNRIIIYEELQESIWSNTIMTDNAIRSLVRNLRSKLPEDFIVNLSGIGYKLG
jgi:two-component system response regulator VanR